MKLLRRTLFILASTFVACDSGHQNQSANEQDTATSIVSIPAEIDSSAFELLMDKIEDPDRTEWQNPQLVIEQLGSLEDKTVADIGAGTGYFTFIMAPKARKVIAIDIDERFLDVIDSRKSDLEPEYSERIETRLSEEDDPTLAPDETDAVVIVNTYHFLSNRKGYLMKLKAGMKPGGTILIVDFKNDQMEVAPPGGLVVPADVTSEELKQTGFKNVTVDLMSLKYQYIIKANK